MLDVSELKFGKTYFTWFLEKQAIPGWQNKKAHKTLQYPNVVLNTYVAK